MSDEDDGSERIGDLDTHEDGDVDVPAARGSGRSGHGDQRGQEALQHAIPKPDLQYRLRSSCNLFAVTITLTLECRGMVTTKSAFRHQLNVSRIDSGSEYTRTGFHCGISTKLQCPILLSQTGNKFLRISTILIIKYNTITRLQ